MTTTWDPVVPLLYDSHPSRRRPLQLVLGLYWDTWQKRPLIAADSTIAGSRNGGARVHLEAPGDVLVFNDADSIVAPAQLEAAVEFAADGAGPVWCFDLYCRLGERTTAELETWRDALDAPVVETIFRSSSAGAVAIRRDCFELVGGFDESYGNACEDLDFARRCAARWDPRRVEGELVHLWHERPDTEPENTPQAHRYTRETNGEHVRNGEA
jgi:hypothetical protein